MWQTNETRCQIDGCNRGREYPTSKPTECFLHFRRNLCFWCATDKTECWCKKEPSPQCVYISSCKKSHKLPLHKPFVCVEHFCSQSNLWTERNDEGYKICCFCGQLTQSKLIVYQANQVTSVPNQDLFGCFSCVQTVTTKKISQHVVTDLVVIICEYLFAPSTKLCWVDWNGRTYVVCGVDVTNRLYKLFKYPQYKIVSWDVVSLIF